MEPHRHHVKPHTCTHAHTCKPRLLKHFLGKYWDAHPRSLKSFFCKILGRSSKIAKAFFCKSPGALGTEVHKLGVLALCWGNWAQKLGEPGPHMRGNRSPGDGGTGRPRDAIRYLFLTVRTPRQAWLGNQNYPSATPTRR